MEQDNVYVNTGTIGINGINYGMSGASGTNYSNVNVNFVASGTNYLNTNYGASGTNYLNTNLGPSGTQSNINVNIGSSGTNFINNNQLYNEDSINIEYNNLISGISLHNIYNKVGITDEDFIFHSSMLYDTKRKYELSYKGINFFDFIVDINELDDDNLICNGQFKKMLKYINLIIDTTDDTRIIRYLKRIIDIDYFINKKIVRSIHITI